MFRRSRFSIRPNVGTAGRTAATSQETPSVNQEASETPKDAGESSTATAVTDCKSVVTPSEKPTASGDGNDQNGEGTSSSAAVQRRKRFSVKPKVAPGRLSTLARTPKSPAKAVSETTVEISGSDLDKPTTSSQIVTRAPPEGLQSPRRRRPSEDSKQLKVQPQPTLISSDSPGPSTVPPAEDSLEQTHLSVDSGKQSNSTSDSQIKEVPPRPPDKVPPSLPDKEATELSEKAKTLVSSKSGLYPSAPKFSLSRLLNDPSDLQRLAKARKLRELLKQEMHKEKKLKKSKARAKEYTIDPAKMTMRDLIRYLPLSNPMTSSLEDSAQENETVVPPSPERQESPERAQEPEALPKTASPREEVEEEEAEAEVATEATEAAEAAEAEAEEEEDQDDALMVPQVKVAEDGSLIIDEESLTVEVLRAKGPNPAQGRDPIFERGSTTTYSSFRKGTYSKPWSTEETDMFFLAVSMVGTDFSMICQLFPHRARSEIKNKFKKEERENSWRIDKAFRERRKLDIEYFSKLLEKILEVQKNRKKLRKLCEKNAPKKHKRKTKGKKAARKLSDVEEEEEGELPDFEEEEEGEKENEELCNEGGSSVSKPKRKRKRKNDEDASTEEPNDKKKQTGEKSNEQGEACIPEDAEAALPEDCTNSDMSDKTAAKDTAIKPAKLSRGRAPKPLLPLGRKWGKKPPPTSTKAKDSASDKGDESMGDGALKEQVKIEVSPSKQANESADDGISSEDEDYTVQPPRPTRYGRVPKPTKHLNYLAKEDAHSSASETTPASAVRSAASDAKHKGKSTTKRGRSSKSQSAQESKKPKLVTLRASQSDYSDEDDENQSEEREVEEQWPECSSSKDSSAPVFVPAFLRSPQPRISEVEETMEELDILANMPDVLGISQDALCPDASCKRAQNETGTAEPCEHQLDLLVDVIDFLSEHTEVSEDESYNEAAQTLLTIGNLAHLSQSAQNQTTTHDHITGITSVSVNETSQHLEEEIAAMSVAQEETSATPSMSAASGHGVTETSEIVATVEPQNSATDKEPSSQIGDLTSDQTWSEHKTVSDMDPTPQLQSSPEISKKDSLQIRRGRISKVKRKPNLGRASRTALSKSQPDTSTVETAEESQTVAPDLSQATEIQPAAEETTPKLAECSPASIKDDISSENQNQSFSGAQFEASWEPATRDTRYTDEKLTSHAGIIESGCNNPATSDTTVTESQVEQRSNTDSVTVQESSDRAAASVTRAEELPVCQKEESEVASTNQTRKSRFQKVKPKPKLPQTSRTLRSKPQTTKDPLEENTSSSSNLESTDKTIAEIESQPTCTTCPEKPSTSVVIPSLDLSSTLIPTEELSSVAEKKTDVGLVDQVDSDAATLDQSDLVAQFEPSWEQTTRDIGSMSESTDEKLMSHAETTASICNNPATSDSAITGSQVEHRSNTDSVTVQESSDHAAASVTPAEELPVCQKEESEVASTNQTKKSRFQKVKPKPKLPQTSRAVRSKPQTTKGPLEENTSSPTNLVSTDKTIAEIESQPTCTTCPEKPSTSVLIPSLDLGSTLIPPEELSSIAEKKTDVGLVDQVDSGAATLDQSDPVAQFEPSWEQTTRDIGSTSESTDEKLMSEVRREEGNDNPAACIESVEELPVSQKEESKVASTNQTRRSRLQKVKPNLPQTSRAVRSKPQTTKDLLEENTSSSSNLESTGKTIAEMESQPTCTTCPEKPSTSILIPSLDLGSTLIPTEELSSIAEKKTDVGLVDQVDSGAATLDQSDPVAQFEPNWEQTTRDIGSTSESTDEKLMSRAETTANICNSPVTSDSAITGSQVEHRSNTDSVTVQESSDCAAASVTLAEELPVCQKEESEVASTNQTRRSRFQKVKPKPKLPQTSRAVRSKPQTTKDPLEENTSSSINLESTDKTTAEIQSQPTCTTCPEKPSTSVLIPSLDLGSTLIPTEELSSIAEKKTDVGLIDQVDSGAATLDQSDPVAQFEPSLEQTTRDIGSTSESTDEKLMSHAETTASICNNPATSDSAITESQVRRGEEGNDNPVACIKPVEEFPVCQKEESKVASTCQTRRSRLQKVKPNLPQTSRTVRSKTQTTKDPVTYMQPVEKNSSPTSKPESSDNTVTEVEPQPTCSTTSPEKLQSTGTASVLIPSLELGSTHEAKEELSSAGEKNTNVGLQLDSSSEGSEQNIPQRRRRFAKAKPNLGSSTRTTQSTLQPKDISKFSTQHSSAGNSEQQPVDNKSRLIKLEPTEKDSKPLTSPHSEMSLNSPNDKGSSSDSIVIATSSVAENQSTLTGSTAENKSSEKPTVEGEATGDSTSNHNKVEASKDGSTESKIKSILPANVQSTPDPKESTQQQHSKNESEMESQDSETTETNRTTNDKSQAPKCTDDTQSSRKSAQARRGRLVKPKPNLGRSSRPPQPQQVQNTTQAETDSGTCSEGVDASGSHTPVTEVQPDIQETVEGAIEQLSNKEFPSNDAGPSSGCVTQVPDNSTQDASTSSTARTQSCQSISIFPDMLSVPSDPDEPFFILSLTEIPVCSSGEVVDSVPEPPPYLPVTDASIQQQSSVPGESVAAGGHVALSDVLEPVSTEETGQTGLINVKDIGPDPFAYISSVKENPVDPHESTEVQPPELPNTVENSEETNIPPTKQRLTGAGRRAKLQVKPSTTKKKQASKTLAAKEAELIPIQADTSQDSELPGPSVQPEAFDAKAKAGEEVVTEPQKGSSDHVDTEKETCGKDPEDSSSGTQARGTSSRNRKPKGFLSFLRETDSTAPSNNPPRGKAASKGPKVKTAHAARKRSTPAPVASTSRNVHLTTTQTQMEREEPLAASSTTSSTRTEVDIEQRSRLCSDSPPSTSQCTAEVSVSQQSDCVESSSIEEEPTSVSQYFLSDIFTEVEEG